MRASGSLLWQANELWLQRLLLFIRVIWLRGLLLFMRVDMHKRPACPQFREDYWGLRDSLSRQENAVGKALLKFLRLGLLP